MLFSFVLFQLFFTFHLDTNDDETSHISCISADGYLSLELQLYIREEVIRIGSSFDISQWWQLNKSKFPILFKIYIKYFYVPASSSVCESEFSYTGLVVTDRRSRILPENVNDLMVARNSCD